ncbi:MAG: hypothetical protein J7K23_02015 [Thermoproteales archaeon]|nr:hypothetical protein [Thermoproteales archaeon]
MSIVFNPLEAEEVDYEEISEEWNVYRLKDGTILRIKLIVSKFLRTKDKNPVTGYPNYIVAFKNVIDIKSTNRSGPRPPPSPNLAEIPEELKEEVEVEEIINEKWNQYKVEGKYIYEIKPVIVQVFRIKDYYDPLGYPIYHVISQSISRIRPLGEKK